MKNYLLSMLVMLFAGVTLQAEALACATPTKVQVQRTSASDATLNAVGGSSYGLYITPHGDDAPTAATPARNGYTNVTMPFFSDDLFPQFDYDLYIRTNCAAGEKSDWVGPFFVPVYIACGDAADANITVVRTSPTDATMTADAGVYDVYLSTTNAGPADVWTTPNFGMNDISMPYSRNDLNANLSYNAWFRLQCNETQVSEWFGPINIPLYSDPCPVPTAIDLTRTSGTTATVDGANPAFTYQGSANRAGRYLRDRVMYGMENMTLPWTQSNLVPAFDYDIWLRTECGDGSVSAWSGPFYLPTYSGGARSMTISPNPSKGQVMIQGMDAVNVQVIGMTGKTELSTPVVNNEINVSNLAPGNYIIQAQDADGNVSTTKLIKK